MKHNYVPDGCFLIARQMFESAIWRDDPHVLKLFIYLIGSARHNKTPKKYPSFDVKRGELVTSLARISEENEYNQNGTIKSWARMKISRMLDLLEKQGYIERLCDTYGTHISICNYDTYQDLNNYKCDTVVTGCDTVVTEVLLNKNGNKDKKEKKVGKGKTNAPESLTPTDSLLKFFEKEAYWKENQQDLIDACLDHFRGNGEQKKDWEATVRSWCRKHKEWNPKNYESEGGITVDDSGLKFNTIEEGKAYLAEEASKRTCAGDMK